MGALQGSDQLNNKVLRAKLDDALGMAITRLGPERYVRGDYVGV